MRTFFNKPIREETTAEFYPSEMTAKEFFVSVLEGGESFVKNMEHYPDIRQKRYAEEWMETFCAWSEIEQE